MTYRIFWKLMIIIVWVVMGWMIWTEANANLIPFYEDSMTWQ